jgi:DNA-binding GntR family transcriptional regulator
VSDDLRRRCHDGDFASGVPGEMSLAVEYKVSRHTVREALRPLRQEGLIRSQRGRSSTVPGTPDHEPIAGLLSAWRGVGAVALRHLDYPATEDSPGTVAIRARPADESDARLLDCPVGTPLLVVRGSGAEPGEASSRQEILIRADRREIRASPVTALTVEVLGSVGPLGDGTR